MVGVPALLYSSALAFPEMRKLAEYLRHEYLISRSKYISDLVAAANRVAENGFFVGDKTGDMCVL